MNDFRLSTDVRPRRYQLRFDLDLEGWRSTGSARIDLATGRATRVIVLHSCDLDIGTARLDGEPAVDISYDEDPQTASLEFASEIAPGDHVLELEWQGEIRGALRGLYRSVRGEERYAATQFEAADARRAFPCFDEPEFKARFALELVHPKGLMAVANMPIARQEDAGDGRTRTAFEETPTISSYLVAFTVGPYEATLVATTRTGIPIRVVLPPGLAARGEYARDAHVRALEWLEDYTGIPYQYRKVDAIGLPDFDAGAMENPGAITYRVRLLAADRRTASVAVLKDVFSVAAHELTHMWWGDLVTMRWWDDLWLNESFASFVGERATAALNPEWDHERDMVRDIHDDALQVGGLSAFTLDSLATTHPISMEARNAEEASERFDAITYAKGQAVLRMIEGYLGAVAFRDGVRIYLQRHREANATADDFWRALDEASTIDVTSLARAWIHEPGHPLVRCAAREEGDGLAVALRQERFFADPEARDTGQLWPVPMVIAYGTATGRREERVLLDAREATVRLPGARWYFPNAGATGFYRYALDDASVRLLVPVAGELRSTERLDLVSDLWALVRGRRASVSRLVDLIVGLPRERDRVVLATIGGILSWLDEHAVTDAARPAFQRLVDRVVRRELDALGWEPRPDDSEDERQKRALAIAVLGRHAGAADVRREARRRIDAHLAGSARIAPDLAAAVAAVAAIDGDAELLDRYVQRMRDSERTDAQEEARFRNALASFRDPGLVARVVALAFSDVIREQDRSVLIPAMLGLRHAREQAWSAVRDRWDERIATADPGGKQRFVNGVGQLTPAVLAAEAIAFLEARRTGDMKETASRAIERIRILGAAAARIAVDLPATLEKVTERARA